MTARRSPRGLAIALGALILIVAAVGVVMVTRGGGGASPLDARVTAQMPLEPGDLVTVDLPEHRACSGMVVAVADDQRVGIDGCSPELAYFDRAVLRVPQIHPRSVEHPKSGDLVLVQAPDGWHRRQVVTPASAGQLAVRGYGASASVEEKVPEQGVLLVRPTSVAQTKLWMPLPNGLALKPTDLVLTTVMRGTLATRTYALIIGGDPQGPVDLQPVVLRNDEVANSFPEESSVARSRLKAQVLRYSDYVRAGDVLAVRLGGKYTRVKVVEDAGRGNARVIPEEGGAESVIEKAGALRLRGLRD